MEQNKTPGGLIFVFSLGLTLLYVLMESLIGGLKSSGGDEGGIAYLAVCFFLLAITFGLSFLPFASGKRRWTWWVLGIWFILSLIVLSALVLRGFFYNPTGIG